MIMRTLGKEIDFFEVKDFKVFCEEHWSGSIV